MKPSITILLVALLASPTAARTWNIHTDGSGDAPTVQAGIDSSAAFDTVLVHPGTYNEAIDFLGKSILVTSLMGAEATTLDASGLSIRTVVTFHSGETQNARLRGFTVTGGDQGILVEASSATICENIVTENGGVRSGAGIWCTTFVTGGPWHPVIKDNIVTKNVAGNISGGIGVWTNMVAEITDNYVAENQAIDGDGGGIFFRGWVPGGVVRGNVVRNNFAGDHGGGVYAGSAIYGKRFEFELSWNVIAKNVANGREGTGDSGGGVWLEETDAWVHHNTIVENEGYGSAVQNGGGVVIGRPGSPLVEKNIIALSVAGGGIWCSNDATPIIRNNLAWQNTGGDGVGDCPNWWQSDGNIVVDPNFCDADGGDYSLAQNSPAITHYAGPLGAFPIPGCGPVAVLRTTWGRLKSRY